MSKSKSVLAMCVYCTETNGRLKYTQQCLDSLTKTVDWNNNEIVIIDQNSIPEAKLAIDNFISNLSTNSRNVTLISLSGNIGTARGINEAIKLRKGRHVIKIDDDIVWEEEGWVEKLEHVVDVMPGIGAIGLKRLDLIEATYRSDPNFRSVIHTVPHNPGEHWMYVEEVKHLMGSCCMYTAESLKYINALWQPSNYGFDDSIYSAKNQKLGLANCFLLGPVIHHVDDGSNSYTQEKQRDVSEQWAEYERVGKSTLSGDIPVWSDFY